MQKKEIFRVEFVKNLSDTLIVAIAIVPFCTVPPYPGVRQDSVNIKHSDIASPYGAQSIKAKHLSRAYKFKRRGTPK